MGTRCAYRLRRTILGICVCLFAFPSGIRAQDGCGTYAATRTHFATSALPDDLPIAGTSTSLRDDIEYSIPVVVHVVWNEAAENITNGTIHQMIARLNADFSRANDQSRVRALFQPSIADMALEFCLANRTPTGQTTTGIIRHWTTVQHFNVDDPALLHGMKESPTGSPAWDPSRYLNIWFCDLAGPTFPSGVGGFVIDPNMPGIVHSAVDGVVLDYRLGLPPYGPHAATHEVGHYFGLMHPWGNDEPANCASTDEVDDTPHTNGATFVCTDPNLTKCPPDLVQYENFMDYAPQCAALFTLGQKQRARNFLLTRRPDLADATLCGTANIRALRTSILRTTVLPDAVRWEWTGQASRLMLFDAQGRTVHQDMVTGEDHSFATDHLAPGMYTVILLVDEQPMRGRFVLGK